MAQRTIWALTDGTIGMVNQALGLAEAVAAAAGDDEPWTVVDKRFAPSTPWRWLPAALWPPGVLGVRAEENAPAPPWPDLVVSCGRSAVGVALAIKRRSGGRSFVVHTQHPRVDPQRFDLVVAQAHDRLAGPNVVVVLGSLHRVTRAKLDAAAQRFRDLLAALPRPLVAVLVGGNNKVYRLTPERTRRLADDLAALIRTEGAGLAVTPSRRTGAENAAILRERLAGLPAIVWDGKGENPYFGFLGLADAVIVTCDSVNMVSEACATGKPVHVIALEGRRTGKFDRFHAALREAGLTRPFRGRIERWSYPPLEETTRVAHEVLRRMKERGLC